MNDFKNANSFSNKTAKYFDRKNKGIWLSYFAVTILGVLNFYLVDAIGIYQFSTGISGTSTLAQLTSIAGYDGETVGITIVIVAIIVNITNFIDFKLKYLINLILPTIYTIIFIDRTSAFNMSVQYSNSHPDLWAKQLMGYYFCIISAALLLIISLYSIYKNKNTIF